MVILIEARGPINMIRPLMMVLYLQRNYDASRSRPIRCSTATRELYFEGGTSSVYLWELDGDDFAGCFLIKKKVSGHEFVTEGCWDSIHVVEVNLEDNGKAANYKLTTTVILTMDVQKESVGDTNLSYS